MLRALRLIFPPQCICCGELVENEHALYGSCWRATPFIGRNICDRCGAPLPGDVTAIDECCDDCITIVRPWKRGRAALLYRDNARRIVLSLKHGDRQDLVKPATRWMVAASQPILTPDMVVVPVPAHWLDCCSDVIIKRRCWQSRLGANAGLSICRIR
jgi:predicted amidophosphoribosyltransferase